MKLDQLKIKRMTLAHEARLIRKEEVKARNASRFLTAMADPGKAMARLDEAARRQAPKGEPGKPRYTPAQLRRIKAQIVKRSNMPYDVAAAKAAAARASFYEHRMVVVRPAARAAHLAHAYLTGATYTSTETKDCMDALSGAQRSGLMLAVAKNVRYFGGDIEQDCRPKDIEYWIEGGHTLAQEEAMTEAGEDGVSSKLAEV